MDRGQYGVKLSKRPINKMLASNLKLYNVFIKLICIFTSLFKFFFDF